MITKEEYEEYKQLVTAYELQQRQMRADYEKIKYAKWLFDFNGWHRAEKIVVYTEWNQASGNDGNGPSYNDKAEYNIENVAMFQEVMEKYIEQLKNEFEINYEISYLEYAKSIR